MSYPQYAASLFAGNDFFRSLFAFGAVLFSRSMFINLGVAKGITLLAGLAVIGIVSKQAGKIAVSNLLTHNSLGYLLFGTMALD